MTSELHSNHLPQPPPSSSSHHHHPHHNIITSSSSQQQQPPQTPLSTSSTLRSSELPLTHHHQQHHQRSAGNNVTTTVARQHHHPHHHQQQGTPTINNNNNFVIVELHRDDQDSSNGPPGFGFNIKGGAEHGRPVYIWRVEPGSLADRSGLKSGDEIIQANGTSFTGITHAEALKVLKNQTTLTLYIKAPSNSTATATTSTNQQQQQRRPPPPPPPLPHHQLPQIPHHHHPNNPILHHQPPPHPHHHHHQLPQPPVPPPLIQQQQPTTTPSASSSSPHHRVEYYTWVDRHGNPVPPPTATTTQLPHHPHLITTPSEIYDPSAANPPPLNTPRLIPLQISPGQNLGLMIRGGSEYGLGIYVTGVDPGSVAESSGLMRGDELLSVNSSDFTHITHDKAVQILKSSKHMQIIASYIGKIPADLNDGEDLLKLNGGGGSSTVVHDDDVDRSLLLHHHHPHHHHHHHDDVIVDELDNEVVDIINEVNELSNEEEEEKRRVMTSTSASVSHTRHHHSLVDAELAALNDSSEIEDDLVDTLTSHHHHHHHLDDESSLDLNFVGTQSTGNSLGTGTTTKRCTTSILQMIEEKARTVLNKSEHSRFTFYRIEYMQGFLPVVAFVRILLELLNTSEKYTLLTEVRELIRPTDLTQFDELIYMKSTSFRLTSASSAGAAAILPPPPPPPPLITTAAPPQQPFYDNQQQQPGGFPGDMMMHGGGGGAYVGDDGNMVMDDFIEEHGVVLDPSGGFGAWRAPGQGPNNVVGAVGGNPMMGGVVGQQPQQQIPTGAVMTGNPTDNRQLLITHDPAALTMTHPQILTTTAPMTTTTTSTAIATTINNNNNVNNINNRSPLANKLLQQQSSSLSAATPLSTSSSSSVPAVRFKVRITKVKPILGIAIEGGSNTPHRLPRIIDVNPDGSAFHSNLRAGQVLLTVDGKKLDGLSHEEIARLILDCYVDMTKSQIEFLVVEAKQNYYYFLNNPTATTASVATDLHNRGITTNTLATTSTTVAALGAIVPSTMQQLPQQPTILGT